MKHKKFLFVAGIFALLTSTVISCSKNDNTTTNPPLPAAARSASFVEEFDTVGNLVAKGWVFKNNSFPIGQSGWRQGRYEASSSQYSAFNPTPFFGFQAYSSHNTPNDFISCDLTAGNDANTGSADINAWLISPQLPMRNGDSIIFYTRSLSDAAFYIKPKDRMQVRANFVDGSSDVGGGVTSVGSFTRLLADINPNYVYNSVAGGYPRQWTRVKIVMSGIPGDSVRNGRFAFRYMSTDAGILGGSVGYPNGNYPGVVGIDSLAFGRK